MSKLEKPTYWKPEPKLYGLDFWALFLPALTFTVGVILFGGEAIKAGDIVGATQGAGSWLMVIGGEIGTLASASEVFRKSKDGRANWLDVLGIVVSLIATLGVLFVSFVKRTTLTTMWIEPVRNWGPLVLLLCSGVDFYANVMEFAFYRAHFDDQWSDWNDAKHVYEQTARTRAENSQRDVQPERQEMPLLTGLRTSDRRAALIDVYNDSPDATSDDYATLFDVSASTIRRDLGILRKDGKINGHTRKVVEMEAE